MFAVFVVVVVSCRAANLFYTLVMKVLRTSRLSFSLDQSDVVLLLGFLFALRLKHILAEIMRWSDATLTNESKALQFFALFFHFRLMIT